MATDLVTNLSKKFKKIFPQLLIYRKRFFNRAEGDNVLNKMMLDIIETNVIDKLEDIDKLDITREFDEKNIINNLGFRLKQLVSDISEEEAKRKVVKEINDKIGNVDITLVICEYKTVQLASGWIFYYDSERYLETGKKRFMICGNYPIFISKRTQKTYYFYPGVTLDSIEEEDKKLRFSLMP